MHSCECARVCYRYNQSRVFSRFSLGDDVSLGPHPRWIACVVGPPLATTCASNQAPPPSKPMGPPTTGHDVGKWGNTLQPRLSVHTLNNVVLAFFVYSDSEKNDLKLYNNNNLHFYLHYLFNYLKERHCHKHSNLIIFFFRMTILF